MGVPTATRELHEAAREEWLASRVAVRSRRAELLEDIRGRLDAGEGPDRDILPALYRELAAERLVDAMVGFVFTRKNETMMLGFIAGVPETVMERCLELEFGQGICGTVARTRRGVHVTDVEDSTDPVTEFARSSGITACVCLPLLVGYRLFGTLTFASRTRRRFDAEEIDFFVAIAEQLALARHRHDRNPAARA